MRDAEAIFSEYGRDPEATKYLARRPSKTIEDTRSFLERSAALRKDGKTFLWVITAKADGRLLGAIEARVDGHKVELGYVLAKKYWGSGYMTEAVRAVIDWALGENEIYRVWAVCDLENIASARVLEKAGMRLEGILRRWSIHPNLGDEPRDCYCYARTK
jgi:RimJ/RimL family protein N-acetyltransferase